MSRPCYLWRQLTPKQRVELLAWRKERGYPWHSPPHRPNFGHLRFLISAACYEHGGCSSAFALAAPDRLKAGLRTIRVSVLSESCRGERSKSRAGTGAVPSTALCQVSAW